MGQVDRDFLLGLKDWLCNTYRTRLGKKLADYTVINYMGCLRSALNEAVRAEIIPDNTMNKLTLGADLYTVSKLLGHSKIETTMIYGKIINRKKEDAVGLLDKAFE